MDERELDGTQAGDGPGTAGVDVERLREIKLMGFLRELDRQEGRMATAALLGVNYKTVARALDEDRVTGRMADALELLLGAGGDSELERLRQQVRLLAERMAALEEPGDVPPVVSGPVVGGDLDGDGVGDDDGGVEQEQASAQPGDVNGGASSQQPPLPPLVAGLGVSRPARRRRVDPELVTREPAEDDPEVYGDAWPLVNEWRELKARHPVQGRSLSWLTDHEHLLNLELAMLEEHGLTLPPAKEPVKGLARRDHTRWRWKALHRTQVAIRKRKLLRWLRRLLTLGAWRN